jgi:AcrR family transcriptional regulator
VPRAYRLGARQAGVDAVRTRILNGTRELLMAEDGFKRFTMEGIARQADVARMTVYNQFHSKAELLEALFDDLARRGRLRENLRRAFAASDARAGLVYFVIAFVTFFASERAVMRKLSGLSVLDPIFAEVSREGRRRRGARAILERLRGQTGKPTQRRFDEATDLVYALTSFQTFDLLATRRRSARRVAAILCGAVGDALGIEVQASDGSLLEI